MLLFLPSPQRVSGGLLPAAPAPNPAAAAPLFVQAKNRRRRLTTAFRLAAAGEPPANGRREGSAAPQRCSRRPLGAAARPPGARRPPPPALPARGRPRLAASRPEGPRLRSPLRAPPWAAKSGCCCSAPAAFLPLLVSVNSTALCGFGPFAGISEWFGLEGARTITRSIALLWAGTPPARSGCPQSHPTRHVQLFSYVL